MQSFSLLRTLVLPLVASGLLSVPALPEPAACSGEPAACTHADEPGETQAAWAWRYVTHYGCGWTDVYWVKVLGCTTLLCSGCGLLFRASVRW